MKTEQITPGPWRYGKWVGDSIEIVAKNTFGGPDFAVATANRIPILHDKWADYAMSQVMANAHAIAALPELMGALQDMIDAANTTSDEGWAIMERPTAAAVAVLTKLVDEGGAA